MTDQASAVSRTVRKARQSRRHLLAAGTGALAVMAADAIARPVPADASSKPVVLGQANAETTTTSISNTAAGVALICSTAGTDEAVLGQATDATGVKGISNSKAAVFGISNLADGVVGVTGGNSVGVHGFADVDNGLDAIAVLGENSGGTAVKGNVTGNGIGIGVHGLTDGEIGVFGENVGGGAGISGVADSGTGVAGQSGSGAGVTGVSSSGKGVYGQHGGTAPSATIVNQHGVHGATDSVFGHGVLGEHLGLGAGVAGSSKSGGTGVSGDAAGGGLGGAFSSDTGTGMLASSTAGKAVWGSAGNGGTAFSGARNGVHGLTDSGTDSGVLGENASGGPGVQGVSSGGIGVLASGKTALRVDGPAVFSRSGTLTIAAGLVSATQQGVAVTAGSIVLVTAQNDVPGAMIRSAVPDVTNGAFTVSLGAALSADITVGWFVVN